MKLSDIRDFDDFRVSSRIHLGKRPRIGLTMFSGRESGKFYTQVQYNYVQSIVDAGGIPILIPSLPDLEVSAQFAAGIHGLILSGSTLYQDLPGETGTALGHTPFDNPMESLHHSITIEPDSALGCITESSELLVNSFHHQAVKTLGRGLKVSARSPDKVIEAAEESAG